LASGNSRTASKNSQPFCWLIEREEWKNFTPAIFSKLLDNLSDQVIANGLTPEILEEILHES
jgi:hypothetical protein